MSNYHLSKLVDKRNESGDLAKTGGHGSAGIALCVGSVYVKFIQTRFRFTFGSKVPQILASRPLGDGYSYRSLELSSSVFKNLENAEAVQTVAGSIQSVKR
jgi:hypothetical protein